jgi:RNase H-fold protein (predicted Holliday junction resolvase)
LVYWAYFIIFEQLQLFYPRTPIQACYPYQLDSLWVEYQESKYQAQWCEEYSNPDVDIAILKIDIKDAQAVKIINPADLATSVTVYGFPPTKARNFPEGFDVVAKEIDLSAPLNVISTYTLREVKFTNPWNKSPQEKATEKNAVCRFLEEIEGRFKYLKLSHIRQQEIALKDQYIPIQVTLERRYTHEIETTLAYQEGEAELKRIYALKGFDEERQKEEIKKVQVDWLEAKKEH